MKTRLIAVVLLAGACGSSAEPADPQTARARSRDGVAVLDDLAAALEFTADSEVMSGAEGSFVTLNGSMASAVTLPENLHVITPPAAGEASWREEVTRYLEDHIFTDDNYEGDGVYRLRGEDFCPVDELTGAPDPECVADFDAAELRIRATLAGDGLDLALLVGPDRAEPLQVELRSDRLTVIVDLAQSKEALVHIASVTGETVDLPRVFEGVLAAEIASAGPTDATASVSIRQAVRVEGDLADGAGAYAVFSALKDPLFSIHAEGAARRLTIDLDVGETTVRAPWASMASDTLASGILSVDLKGLSGSIILEEAVRQLRLENLGFGDAQTTIKLDDHVLYSLDLNASSGRRVAMTATPDGSGGADFAFSPGLDLAVGTHLAPLAAAGDVVDSWLLDDVYHVVFGGADPVVIRPVPGDATTGEGGGLKLVAGQLRLATDSGTSVVVPAGQCLVEDLVTDGENPILGAFAAAPCP